MRTYQRASSHAPVGFHSHSYATPDTALLTYSHTTDTSGRLYIWHELNARTPLLEPDLGLLVESDSAKYTAGTHKPGDPSDATWSPFALSSSLA